MTLLVTGDKTDLLTLRRVASIPILSAREAVERIECWRVGEERRLNKARPAPTETARAFADPVQSVSL